MIGKFVVLLLSLTFASANFFNMFNGGFGGRQQQPEGRVGSPEEYENNMLNTNCGRYLCPDTGLCVDAPKFCPCPYPSSQLRCFLPDGKYLCISKPSGDIASNYDDASVNWKVDAKDDNIRDCGWVSRAWKGLV